MKKWQKNFIVIGLISFSFDFWIAPLLGQEKQTTFEQRRQAWLDRNGADLSGEFDDRVFYGRPYLFAWLEKNLYITDRHPSLGNFHDQLIELYDERGDAGCRTGIHLSRIFYQYAHKLKDPAYPYPNDWNDIKNLLRFDAHDDHHIDTRSWKKSTQMERTVTVFLYTLEYDRDATVTWPTGTFDDIQFYSDYSHQTYIPGNSYRTYELSRDWIFYAMDTWAKQGSSELDGNYSGLALHSLLMLYDFAGRPLARLGGRPDPDGVEMQKRAKMMLDLLLLDHVMDFSANHHGGSFGRIYRYNITHAQMKSLYHAYFGVDTGDSNDDGDAYVSSYRVPELIEDLGILWDEPSEYWHMHLENNLVGSDPAFGKWTFVTKYFNLGGAGNDGGGWQLAIYSEDQNGPRSGQPFRLWIDTNQSSADPDESLNEYTNMGSGRMYQFRNAALLKFWAEPHVHVCQDGNRFDVGQELLRPASSFAQDYFIDRGWNFFLEGKVAIALRLDDNRTGAMEVVIIDPEANAEHCYPSFSSFKDAVQNRAQLTADYFRTSRGHIIEASENGGSVDGQPIWNFPFPRMETIDYQGKKLIAWHNNIMTVSKNHRTIRYDFNNWTYSASKNAGDMVAPQPPTNLLITPSNNP